LAQLGVDAAKDALELYRYTTAVAGEVGEVYVSAGQIITAGMPLVRVDRTDEMYWEAKITPAQAETLKTGTEVQMSAADGKIKCSGIIAAVDKRTMYNALGGTQEEYILRVTPQETLPEQQRARKWEMQVTTAQNTAAALPLQCVVQNGGQLCVYVLRGGSVQAVTVETGRIDAGFVEILAGINAGDVVVAAPQEVREGKRAVAA